MIHKQLYSEYKLKAALWMKPPNEVFPKANYSTDSQPTGHNPLGLNNPFTLSDTLHIRY